MCVLFKRTHSKKTHKNTSCHVSFSKAEGTAVSGCALNRDIRCGPGSIAMPQEEGLEDRIIIGDIREDCQNETVHCDRIHRHMLFRRTGHGGTLSWVFDPWYNTLCCGFGEGFPRFPEEKR